MTDFEGLLQLLAAAKVEFIDLLGEITAGGNYEQLLPHTQSVDVYGTPCLCLDLDELIRVKKATARPKDFEAVAELELIRDRRLEYSTPLHSPDFLMLCNTINTDAHD